MGWRVYRYLTTHVPNTSLLGRKWTGCTHGDDLLFIFGLPLTRPEGYNFTDEELSVSLEIIKYYPL